MMLWHFILPLATHFKWIMDNGDFLEQREQSQACLVYAESQQNWAKPIETFWSSEGRVKLA